MSFITGKFYSHTPIMKIISYDRHIQEIGFFFKKILRFKSSMNVLLRKIC